MRSTRQDGWTRRGFSLLWDPSVLAEIVPAGSVISFREFLLLRREWPDELAGAGGNALVVAGLEGCLDSLSNEDCALWLQQDLKSAVLEFQEHFQGEAALILWLATGRTRLFMDLSNEQYFWRMTAGKDASRIDLGRRLWGGAEADISRILVSEEKEPDPDGPAWVGLYHPRIS